ncbi:MAG: CAP domain-containing protein [Roseivivax sp.]|nr:CAP domain-containing protein [Roseivivax sp.]
MLNSIRANAGRAELSLSPRLQAAAESHAADMARRNYFSHKGRNGSRVGMRVKAQGYRFCTVAENIALGQRSVDQVMREWFASPGHRQNMLAGKVTQYGMARARRDGGDIWVLVLARPGC